MTAELSQPFRMHCRYYACMSKTLTVRDVPTEVLDELAARAAASGRSLQEYVRRHLVDWAARPDAEAWVAQVRSRKAATGGVDMSGVLADRDADRR